MFEHRDAAPTPLGGGAIAHSLIRPAHLAPCHDIRLRTAERIDELMYQTFREVINIKHLFNS